MAETGTKHLTGMDWDGVAVLGANEVFRDSLYQTFDDVNFVPKQDKLDQLFDDRWGIWFDVFIKEALANRKELWSKAIHRFHQILDQTFLERVKAVHGCAELLGEVAASRSLALAVTTASPRKLLVEQVMPAFNVNPDWFDKIVCAEDLPDQNMAKPSGYTLGKCILKELGISPQNADMVGDSENDIQEAMHAGVEPSVVLTGNIRVHSKRDVHRLQLLGVREANIFPSINQYLERQLGKVGTQSFVTGIEDGVGVEECV